MVQAGLAAPYGQYGQGGDAAALALAAAGGVPAGAGSVLGLPAGIKMEKDEVSGGVSTAAAAASSGGVTLPSSATTAVTSSQLASTATMATMAAAAAALDTLSPILVNGVDQSSVTAVIHFI